MSPYCSGCYLLAGQGDKGHLNPKGLAVFRAEVQYNILAALRTMVPGIRDIFFAGLLASFFACAATQLSRVFSARA